jgi:hypothetical protein
MATPDYAKDKNDLPLYTDQIGTERLVIVAGNILDSANNVYNYDRVNDVLTDDATPPNRILQPPTGLRVREAQADAVPRLFVRLPQRPWQRPLLPRPVLHQRQRLRQELHL